MTLKNVLELIVNVGERDQTMLDLTTNKVVYVKETLEDYPNYLLNSPVYYNDYNIIHDKGRKLFSFIH